MNLPLQALHTEHLVTGKEESKGRKGIGLLILYIMAAFSELELLNATLVQNRKPYPSLSSSVL